MSRRSWRRSATQLAASIALLLGAVAPTEAAPFYGVEASVTTLLNNTNGCLEVFAVSPLNNNVWWNTQCGNPSPSWGQWKALWGETHFETRYVAATQANDGRLFVIVHGTDHRVWARWQTSAGSSTWVGWTSVGFVPGGLCGSCLVSVTTNAVGLPEVFASGDQIYHSWFQPNGTWTPWYTMGAGDAGSTDIVATHGPNGLMWISAEFNGALRYRPQTSSSAWGSWTSLGSGWDFPAAARNSNNRMHVFASRMSDQRLAHRYQTSSGWSSWVLTNGTVSGFQPHIAMEQDECGRLNAAVVGTDFHIYVNRESTAGSGQFSANWTALGGTAAYFAYISFGSYASGRLALFVPGTDGRPWFRYQSSCGVWSSNWYPLPYFPDVSS